MKGTRADALKLLLFWPMPIGFGPCQSGWVFDELWSTLVTIHYSFWWLINRKQCNQFQSFFCSIIHLISGWFASWFASRYFCWIVNWFFKLDEMIPQNLISGNRAQTCECICITCWKKDCNQHQELCKNHHCIQSFPFHCCLIKVLNAVSFRFAYVT